MGFLQFCASSPRDGVLSLLDLALVTTREATSAFRPIAARRTKAEKWRFRRVIVEEKKTISKGKGFGQARLPVAEWSFPA
jgi:hypothetical protein